ncbi:uncharacterized protein LOC132047476 [Lycium ferocissimum]|uniref:uncharacterized protein LOC132047476 n=1 Tax=Lycium ferocissimum TaxID=112874 RepID=UPI002814AF62|nr:uncharacterized protein LOC132047476 [Lycium ferocissimum]
MRCPRPLRSDPAQRDPNVVCEYHGTHGHRTEDYRQLRDEVARLLKNRHLREFLSDRPKGNYKSREANKQVETSGTSTRDQHDYHDEDVEGIIQPHNDALVISVLINTSEVKRISIDPSSSTNIIRQKVVEQLGLLDQIVPAARVLSGFNLACETTKEEITLPVNTVGTVRQTKFYVIEGEMRYNAMLGRPWVHNMRAIASMLHKVLKFPTPERVKIVYGEQPVAREMFAAEEAAPRPKALPLKAMKESVEGRNAK